MKKLLAIAFCAVVGFSSCSDDDKNDAQPSIKGAVKLSESFSGLKGSSAVANGWTVHQSVGKLDWTVNYTDQGRFVQTSAYKAPAGSYENWLVSPALNLRDGAEKKVSFDLMYSFYNAASSLEVYVMTDSIPTATNVTKVDVKIPVGTDSRYSWYGNTIDLTPYVAKEVVYIGFKYVGSDAANSTYGVDNFKYNAEVKKGDISSNPLTVSEAIVNQQDSTLAWVKGYVVGVAVSKPSYALVSTGFTSEHNTNIMLADVAGETNLDKCIPVQLPAGQSRVDLNLFDGANKAAVGSQVTVRGNLVKYFLKPGIKNVAEYKK